MGLCLPGLAYGYSLNGDPRCLDVIRQAWPVMCRYQPQLGKNAAQILRQSAYTLTFINPNQP